MTRRVRARRRIFIPRMYGHRSSPTIGRPVKGGLRDLVAGKGARGHVALYRFVEGADTIFIVAIRHQREADYPRGV